MYILNVNIHIMYIYMLLRRLQGWRGLTQGYRIPGRGQQASKQPGGRKSKQARKRAGRRVGKQANGQASGQASKRSASWNARHLLTYMHLANNDVCTSKSMHRVCTKPSHSTRATSRHAPSSLNPECSTPWEGIVRACEPRLETPEPHCDANEPRHPGPQDCRLFSQSADRRCHSVQLLLQVANAIAQVLQVRTRRARPQGIAGSRTQSAER